MPDSIHVDLVHDPIDLCSLHDRLADPDTGAHGWFIGVTRRTTTLCDQTTGTDGSHTTCSLKYQAHEPMARRELLRLATEAQSKFELARVVIVHRLDEVPIGQASVVVGCSSAHRPATFDAQRWIMDRLKRDVPIWKQETYADKTTEWIHPTPPDSPSSDAKA